MLSENQLFDKIENKKDDIEVAVEDLKDVVRFYEFNREARVTLADHQDLVDAQELIANILVMVNELGALKNIAKGGRYRRQR